MFKIFFLCEFQNQEISKNSDDSIVPDSIHFKESFLLNLSHIYVIQSSTAVSNYYINICPSNAFFSTFLHLNNLYISSKSSAVQIKGGLLHIYFKGENKFINENNPSGYNSGIQCTNDGQLIIEEEPNSGKENSITTQGGVFGSGIGPSHGSSNFDICNKIHVISGKIIARGGENGAGIGSAYGTNEKSSLVNLIQIDGGTVEAYGGLHGSGIGCGSGKLSVSSNVNSIVINNGVIKAIGGEGAGIGAGSGSCLNCSNVKNILIKGGDIKVDVTQSFSASIGAGSGFSSYSSSVEVINISHGVINAVKTPASRGSIIGAASYEGGYHKANVGEMNIIGGTINGFDGNGGSAGAGIGGGQGYVDESSNVYILRIGVEENDLLKLNITTKSPMAAAIGAGHGSKEGHCGWVDYLEIGTHIDRLYAYGSLRAIGGGDGSGAVRQKLITLDIVYSDDNKTAFYPPPSMIFTQGTSIFSRKIPQIYFLAHLFIQF